MSSATVSVPESFQIGRLNFIDKPRGYREPPVVSSPVWFKHNSPLSQPPTALSTRRGFQTPA
ncbi:hypothetical protein M407DRAFT_31440 [Tulasnella calospora MUT 4182]|uniref:Uncharacterized protein n=1 Tax=Tulasnella calospora MUT 4182 TaxID=1051891 RepID=A0A0C3Q5K2_9AGAM|nr:hypothetical protein M407DRAFT_31440 [Tulasnella calospora MUT 4182]